MRFSERWLREWVSPPLDTAGLAARLTAAGLEVDSLTPVGSASRAWSLVTCSRWPSIPPLTGCTSAGSMPEGPSHS